MVKMKIGRWREHTEQDEISCEQIMPGWKRQVSDFFAKNLTVEQIAGEAAVKWRAESYAKAYEEGVLKAILLKQAISRFGEAQIPVDLSYRLERYNVGQLTELAKNILASPTLEEWLATFPG